MKNFNKNDYKICIVGLLCVRHTQFEDFFKKFNGVLYDYKIPLK